MVSAAVAGALVWALSPLMTGQAEPWDSETRYFAVALAGAGLVLGLAQPGRAFQHWLGIILGQLGWEILTQHVGALFLVGLIFLPLWSLLTLVCSLLGSAVRWLIGRLWGSAGLLLCALLFTLPAVAADPCAQRAAERASAVLERPTIVVPATSAGSALLHFSGRAALLG